MSREIADILWKALWPGVTGDFCKPTMMVKHQHEWPTDIDSVLTSLNCVDGSVGKRAHCARYETDQHVLIRWELFEVGLEFGCKLLQFLVCSEVDAYRPVSSR